MIRTRSASLKVRAIRSVFHLKASFKTNRVGVESWVKACTRLTLRCVQKDRRFKTCLNTYLIKHRSWSSENIVKSAVLMMMHLKTTFTCFFQIFVLKLWISFDVCTELINGIIILIIKKKMLLIIFYAMYIIIIIINVNSSNVSNNNNAWIVLVFIIIIVITSLLHIYNNINYLMFALINLLLSGKAAGGNRSVRGQQRQHPVKRILEAC